MNLALETDWAALWHAVCGQFLPGAAPSHGPDHWLRVENFGRRLAADTGADGEVVRLFAWLHDAGRVNDGEDPGHGTRGAALAASLRERGLLVLEDERMALLLEACDRHAEQGRHDDPTIATCFDADRLDLARYGIVPDERRLHSEAAKRLAGAMEVSVEWPRAV
jgi:uncharacterized protein